MPEHPRGLDLEPAQLEKFRRIISAQDKPISAVVAQVDPDGLSSGNGVMAAIESLGREVHGYYAGTIGHPQNKTIFQTFGLEKRFSPISMMPSDGPVFLADSSSCVDSRFGMNIAPERFIGVIDHHQDNGALSKPSKERWYRNYPFGSAATAVHQLLKALGVTPDKEVATLLALGVHSDTYDLRSEYTTKQDRYAVAELMDLADMDAFYNCCNFELPQWYCDLLAEMLTQRLEIGEYWLAHSARPLPADGGDSLSLIAAHLQRYEGPHTAIVWGIAGDEIRVSVRSRSRGVDIKQLLADLFGKGNGGAKQGAGGARVKLLDPFIPTDASSKHMIAYLSEQYADKLERRVGSKREHRTKA